MSVKKSALNGIGQQRGIGINKMIGRIFAAFDLTDRFADQFGGHRLYCVKFDRRERYEFLFHFSVGFRIPGARNTQRDMGKIYDAFVLCI